MLASQSPQVCFSKSPGTGNRVKPGSDSSNLCFVRGQWGSRIRRHVRASWLCAALKQSQGDCSQLEVISSSLGCCTFRECGSTAGEKCWLGQGSDPGLQPWQVQTHNWAAYVLLKTLWCCQCGKVGRSRWPGDELRPHFMLVKTMWN